MDGRLSTVVIVFPRLDALHVLDASARFEAGWSGHNMFLHVQIDACAPSSAGHATPDLLIDVQVSNGGNTVISDVHAVDRLSYYMF